MARRSSSRSATTARGCRTATRTTSSSASGGPSAAADGARPAPGWAWRSWPGSWTRTAAGWRRPTPPAAARGSPCAYRRGRRLHSRLRSGRPAGPSQLDRLGRRLARTRVDARHGARPGRGAIAASPTAMGATGPTGPSPPGGERVDGGHLEVLVDLHDHEAPVGLAQVRLVGRAPAVVLQPQHGGPRDLRQRGLADLVGRGAGQLGLVVAVV